MWVSVKRALAMAGKLPRGYYLRWDNVEYNPGDQLPPSRVWVELEPTDRVLPGTSVISPRSPRVRSSAMEFNYYEGRHVYIVTGQYVRSGSDPGEVIIAGAKVVRRLVTAE